MNDEQTQKDKIIADKVTKALEQTAKDEEDFDKLPNSGGIFRPSKEKIFQHNLKKEFPKSR